MLLEGGLQGIKARGDMQGKTQLFLPLSLLLAFEQLMKTEPVRGSSGERAEGTM